MKFNNIKGFKLANGDEIIASIIEETEETYIIEHPIQLILGQHPQEQREVVIQMSPFPWSITCEKDCNITINKINVIALIPTVAEAIIKRYVSATSKIELV